MLSYKWHILLLNNHTLSHGVCVSPGDGPEGQKEFGETLKKTLESLAHNTEGLQVLVKAGLAWAYTSGSAWFDLRVDVGVLNFCYI